MRSQTVSRTVQREDTVSRICGPWGVTRRIARCENPCIARGSGAHTRSFGGSAGYFFKIVSAAVIA
ncbi:hypothetical protein Psi01_58800 [Planobispora siamensis]|uniref:Uncharacterized protein n=1 Tax=Planobispora siamensis TaxID=936338 RepID=A0A8J3SLB2_9ACTN|nr:hypothetical protein Psi01_58800 [Planobispora siamensis]